MELNEYLDKIVKYENDQTAMSTVDFQNMIHEIPDYLQGSYKTRFNRLTFIEIDDGKAFDDIPF